MKKRYTETQIVTKLRQADVLIDKHSQPDVTIRDAEVASSNLVSPILSDFIAQNRAGALEQ